jgi:hypothetical protein
MKHPIEIKRYDSMQSLAKDISKLRYDSLASFLNWLSIFLLEDSGEDDLRGRRKLSGYLLNASKKLETVQENIDLAWEVCKPYMKTKENNK